MTTSTEHTPTEYEAPDDELLDDDELDETELDETELDADDLEDIEEALQQPEGEYESFEGDTGYEQPSRRQQIFAAVRSLQLGQRSKDIFLSSISKEHRLRSLIAIGIFVIALIALSQLNAEPTKEPAGDTPTAEVQGTNPDAGVLAQTEIPLGGVAPVNGGVFAPEQVGQPAVFDVQGVRHHIVQQGENLFRIGLANGLTPEEIAAANGIQDVNLIYIGQDLIIPLRPQAAAAVEVAPVVQSTTMNTVQNTSQMVETRASQVVSPIELGTIRGNQYCVDQGDTLWALSQRFNTTVEVLAGLNNIDPNVPGSLKIGAWIYFPQ